MIKPLSFYIGLRYTRAKRRNHFISFISLASMLGIALGVTVLITVLSVMNGFNYQIRHRFFAIAPQVTVMTKSNISGAQWQNLRQRILAVPDVTGVAPYVSGQGMINNNQQIAGLEIVGIEPKMEATISALEKSVIAGNIRSLLSEKFNIVIGQTLADELNVGLGDHLTLFTPQINMTLLGAFPRYRQFTVAGIFHTSGGFGFENTVAYINLEDAERLFPAAVGTRGFHVTIADLYLADNVSRMIQNILPANYAVTNWTVQFGAFFQALAMEKTMLFIILLLIVAVAAFNLVSTLVMVVNDKRADIAILKTLGASPGMIMRTFIIQGAVIGLVGTLLGLVGGLLLSWNITTLANDLQNLLQIQLIKSSVFFLDYLPSRIQSGDIVKVCFAAIGLSLLATLYPAWLAFRTQPAQALRYE